MIQRRLFLGTAALGLAHFALSKPSFAMPAPDLPALNWRCDVVETLPHTKSRRHPVVTGVDVRAASDLVAVVGDDHYVMIYDVAQGRFTQQVKPHSDWVRSAKFSPDGQRLATGGNDRRLLISNVGNLSKPLIEKRLPVAIIDLAFSGDGSKIATVGFDHKLRVFDANTGKRLGEVGCDCNDNHAVAFSGDGGWIAAGGRSGKIQVWDANNFREVAAYKHHRQRVRSLRFSGDRKVLSVADDQTVCLTDPNVPQTVIKLPRQSAKLFAAQLLGDNFFATSGSDNMITLWSLSNMQGIGILKGHTGTVSCMAAAPGILASGSFDTTLRIWKPELATIVQGPKPIGGQDRQTRNPVGWRADIK